MRFPWGQSPAKHEWELSALNCSIRVALERARQERDPSAAVRLGKERRSNVLRTIHDNSSRQAITGCWCVRAELMVIDDLPNDAEGTVHEAMVDGEIMRDDDRCVFSQLEVFAEAIEQSIVQLQALFLRGALVHCFKTLSLIHI